MAREWAFVALAPVAVREARLGVVAVATCSCGAVSTRTPTRALAARRLVRVCADAQDQAGAPEESRQDADSDEASAAATAKEFVARRLFSGPDGKKWSEDRAQQEYINEMKLMRSLQKEMHPDDFARVFGENAIIGELF